MIVFPFRVPCGDHRSPKIFDAFGIMGRGQGAGDIRMNFRVFGGQRQPAFADVGDLHSDVRIVAGEESDQIHFRFGECRHGPTMPVDGVNAEHDGAGAVEVVPEFSECVGLCQVRVGHDRSFFAVMTWECVTGTRRNEAMFRRAIDGGNHNRFWRRLVSVSAAEFN